MNVEISSVVTKEDTMLLTPADEKKILEEMEAAKRYCNKCEHRDVCSWYPREDCAFWSVLTPIKKKGHWIEGKYRITCDGCRCTYPKGLGHMNYCPNCGLPMERGSQNEKDAG